MTVFQTDAFNQNSEREDSDDYYDMMGNPNVMNPIPRDVMTREESNDHLNMTKATKILLTLPSVLGLTYMLTFWFPTEFHWLVPSMKAYYIQVGTLQALTILQLVLLIRRLWSFKNLEKSKKRDWTWFLIVFNWITSLIFIWKRVDEFEEINNRNNG